MADHQVDVLLIGGGPAAVSCAEALRKHDFKGSVMLATRELDPPYDRPPCSKEYLRGRKSREDLHLHPPSWYETHSIDLRTRTGVMKLDPEAKVATLANKQTVGFSQALIATGAQVRRLRVDGSELAGSHYLRTPGNSDTIRSDAEQADQVVLIGGSYIACEVAASLTVLGKSCTLVMPERAPMALGFGDQVGDWVAELLRSHGIDLLCGDLCGEGLARFEGDDERVRAVVTASGRKLDADMVVLGTGAIPDVMLARAAGLTIGDTGGVACSAALETSAPGIWAAGDMCEYESVVHGRRMRVEHWEHAAAQGRFVGERIAAGGAADGVEFDEVPYFWTDLADWATLEYVGPAKRWDEEVVRGSFESGEFTVFYVDGGRVTGALTAGRPDDLDLARELMRSGEPLPAAARD